MSEQRVTSFDGTNLHVCLEGRRDAPPVLLSHSLGGTLQQWDQLSEALAPHFRIIRYDSRGHGASDVPSGAYHVETLGRDALAIMDALQLERVHFVGLSQGAMAGMWLAATFPARIDKLVLANTTAFIPVKDHWNGLIETALARGLDEIAPKTIHGWLGETYKQANPAGVDTLVRTMASMAPAGYAGAAAALRDVDLRPDLGRIIASTLVIAGVEDGPRGAAAAAALTSAIAHAHRVDLPEAAHLSPIENPVLFNAAVLSFLT